MRSFIALFVALMLLLTLAGCGAETETSPPNQSEPPESNQNSTEKVNELDGITLLNSIFDTLAAGKDVIITLEQGNNHQSYETTLDGYWAIRMPTDEDFNWRGIAEEDGCAAISSEGKNENYRMSLSSNKDDKSWSLMVQSDSNYASLTYDNQEYYFIGAKEYAYDSDWTATMALRSFYDTVEYKSLGRIYDNDSIVFVPNDGQDYLAAALTVYQEQEEAHLNVSAGSRFCFSFVECSVIPAEEETEHFRKEGMIDENTWAIYAKTIFVPENEFAYNESMAGNTMEYPGDDADIPAGALVYGRVGYVTLSADGWHVDIGGTGW